MDCKKLKKYFGIKSNIANTTKFSVAIIDSGIFPHKELSNKIVFFKDFVNKREQAYDDSGHGTAISGIIGGIDTNVNLVALKVLNQDNLGTSDNIIKALKWIKNNKDIYNIKIINISVGIKNINDNKEKTELFDICKDLYDMGLIIITSSGNYEYYLEENLLANVENVISVGSCIYDGNNVYKAQYSQSWVNNGQIIPTIYTFGENIIAPESDVLYKGTKDEIVKNIDSYISVSGTSFSTAIVTGYICYLYEINKNLNVVQIKNIIVSGNYIYDQTVDKYISILSENEEK